MPILTATDPSGKRRAPVWALILTGVVLPMVALIAWSCYRPMVLDVRRKGITLGYWQRVPHSTGFHAWNWPGGGGQTGLALRLRGGSGSGAYIVAYHWSGN